MTATAADFDGDGWLDIYAACDSTASILYRNSHDGTFTRRRRRERRGLQRDGERAGGDGAGPRRLRPRRAPRPAEDPFRGRHPRPLPQPRPRAVRGCGHRRRPGRAEPLRRMGQRDARPRRRRHGRTSSTSPATSIPRSSALLPHYPHRGPRVVFRNRGGSFEEVTSSSGPGPLQAHSSRGAAFGDVDNDGDVDVLVMNMNEPPSLLRNDYAGGNGWLEVRLEGTRSNRAGLGATVVVERGRAHPGPGRAQPDELLLARRPAPPFRPRAAGRADRVEVRWPSGAVDVLRSVDGRRVVAIREGAAPANPR